MDLQALADVYGGLPARVVARAQEVLRLAMAKSALKMDLAAPVACLIVACRALEEPLDSRRLSNLIGVSHRLVEQDVRKVLRTVDARSVLQMNPAALCVRMGCASITDRVTRLHREYLATLASSQRGGQTADPASDPVFLAACLFVCSKQARLRVNKSKLLAEVCANPRAFAAIVSALEAHCAQAQRASSSTGSTRRPQSAAETSDGVKLVSAKRRRTGDGQNTQAKTKAAQRAASLVKQAALEHAQRRDAELTRAREMARQRAITKAPVRSTSPERYATWRAKVLALRQPSKEQQEQPPPHETKPDDAVAIPIPQEANAGSNVR